MNKLKQFYKKYKKDIIFYFIILWFVFCIILGIFSQKIINYFLSYEPFYIYQKAEAEEKPVIKVVSWYSRDRCLGCRDDRIMANREPLDDNKPTCAYNYAPLGTILKLRYKDKTVECVVSDRMGKRLGDERIDLTPVIFESLEELKVGIIEVEVL